MRIKSYFILLGIPLLILIAGCAQQQTKTSETKELDLCNEISNPSASINCKDEECYLLVTGDSRVYYQFNEYGSWGVIGGRAEAGQVTKLNSNTQDRVEITPSYPPSKKCENKKIIVYRNQFLS